MIPIKVLPLPFYLWEELLASMAAAHKSVRGKSSACPRCFCVTLTPRGLIERMWAYRVTSQQPRSRKDPPMSTSGDSWLEHSVWSRILENLLVYSILGRVLSIRSLSR
jgi:hypothetical protein